MLSEQDHSPVCCTKFPICLYNNLLDNTRCKDWKFAIGRYLKTKEYNLGIENVCEKLVFCFRVLNYEIDLNVKR